MDDELTAEEVAIKVEDRRFSYAKDCIQEYGDARAAEARQKALAEIIGYIMQGDHPFEAHRCVTKITRFFDDFMKGEKS